MQLYIDLGLAWVSVFCMVILLMKYFSRKLYQSTKKFSNLNRILKKIHIPLGILLITTGFIHGMTSSVSVFSFNVGTLLWIFTILLGISFVLKSKLNKIKPWIIIHRWLSLATVGILIWHIISVGGIRVLNLIFPPKETTDNSNKQDFYNTSNTTIPGQTYFNNDVILNDGTYTGSAYGYRGNITVSVTVKDNKVTAIEIKSIQDDLGYYSIAKNTIIPNIMKKQSLNVDTVSGATYSSKGIINAVINALSKAVVSGSLPSLR